MTATGRCLCGAVTYTGKGTASGVHVCHCSDCAKWLGGPFMGVTFEDGGDIDGPVRWFKSSGHGERGSCGTCGSALFWRMQDGGFFTDTAGSLDTATHLAPIDEHIFIDSKPAYYDFTGKAPRLTAAEIMARFAAESPEDT